MRIPILSAITAPRAALLTSLSLTAALAASLTYWTLPLLQPAPRPLALAAPSDAPPLDLAAAGRLFGQTAAVSSTFQVRGIMQAERPEDSVAVIVIDGQPPRAGRIDSEPAPGIRILDIHATHVVLSDHGVRRQVSLPPAKVAVSVADNKRPND